jgi:phosphatidylinositol glycan class K
MAPQNPHAVVVPPQRRLSAIAMALALLAVSGSLMDCAAGGAAGGAARAGAARGSGAPHAASRHTSNWAIIVCASRYWLNYRHVSNAMAVYHTVRRLGIPDTHIVMMMADDYACNARNSFPGRLFPN